MSTPPMEWRRTRHLRDLLALAAELDGETTIPQACRRAGLVNESTGYRILAAVKALAEAHPELLRVREEQRARSVYYQFELLPHRPAAPRRKR